MARLPIPGSDDGSWGSILNSYLGVSHNDDGTLIPQAISNAGSEVTSNKNQPNGYAGLNGSTQVPLALLGTGTADNTTFLRGDGTWQPTPGGGSSTLSSLTDVSISGPVNSQVVTYSNIVNKWVNANLPAAPVTQVFGRTGAVVAQTGDYTASQVGALPSTDDLSAIATANPTAGDVSLNTNKLTNIANGTIATDAAAFGQIPEVDSTASDISVVGTAVSAGSTGKWADAGHVHATPGPIPADVGVIAWTIDPAVPNTAAGAPITAGIIYVNAFWIRQSVTLSTLSIKIQTAGSGLTSGENFAGIYDTNGNLLAQTADQTTNWASTGLFQMALTSSTNVNPGMYFAAMLSNGTTPPKVSGINNGLKLVNVGLSGASVRCANNGSAGQFTTLPGTLNMSNNDPNSGSNTALIAFVIT